MTEHGPDTVYVVLRPAAFASETASIAGVYRDMDEACAAAWNGDMIYASTVTEPSEPLHAPEFMCYGKETR